VRHAHNLFGGDDPIEALDMPILAELPFDPEMQSTPAPRADALPEHADDLAAAVDERYEEVWSVDPPADAVDLRGLDPETRTERVEERFRELDAGEECFIVSDRDPAPVRGSCWIWSTPTNSRVSASSGRTRRRGSRERRDRNPSSRLCWEYPALLKSYSSNTLSPETAGRWGLRTTRGDLQEQLQR